MEHKNGIKMTNGIETATNLLLFGKMVRNYASPDNSQAQPEPHTYHLFSACKQRCCRCYMQILPRARCMIKNECCVTFISIGIIFLTAMLSETPEEIKTQYYKHTDYPHLYCNCYWGRFPYDPSEDYKDLFENRNKFVADYNIRHKSCGSLIQFSHIANGIRRTNEMYFDHMEKYRSTDGKYIIIVSPYANPQKAQEVLGSLGFQQIYNLYSDSATTWIRTFQTIGEVAQLKKELEYRHAKTEYITLPNGDQEWRKNHNLHRDGDQPARIKANGIQEWYQYGKLHRDGDQPAIIKADGTQKWYQHGKRHRDSDQPAEIWTDGKQMWYQHGKIHRNDGKPACIWANGSQAWWQHGIPLFCEKILDLQRHTIYERNLNRAHAIYSMFTNKDVAGVICCFCVNQINT